MDADLEQILALAPDLVVLLKSEVELATQLERLGVEVLVVPSDSLADIENAAKSIAERLGDPERGRKWADDFRARLAPTPRESPERPKVLLVVGRRPGSVASLMTAGGETYLGELVRLAGGNPAIGELGTAYRDIEMATALAVQPDIVIEFWFDPDIAADELEADWDDIYPDDVSRPCHQLIAGGHVPVPGPRAVELYADIGAALAKCA